MVMDTRDNDPTTTNMTVAHSCSQDIYVNEILNTLMQQ